MHLCFLFLQHGIVAVHQHLVYGNLGAANRQHLQVDFDWYLRQEDISIGAGRKIAYF